MAILTMEKSEVSGGFSKKINAGAANLMLDILQQHQYQFPIKSTIREIVSNGLDSLVEKEMARKILSGESVVSDYFQEREGEIYEGSKFDPDYYDPAFLSPVDEVDILYVDGGELGKDSVIIRDHGVGLGGHRLESYFDLGYSSKRLLTNALGKFGIGAKSPLSIGVPYYTITSRWNGMEFCFNVYAHRVESIVPKWNEDGESNFVYKFGNGYEAFYKIVDEPNMFQVEIAAKKHHKQQYIDAVTGQLLYFNKVRLFVGAAGKEVEVAVKAQILYEDDLIVLAKNSSYSKPHILLNGVNYGYLNFLEMELEEKIGNIGIKIDPSTVEINPSRESLIWSDKTREAVQARFNDVVNIAQDTINRELKESDFLKWLRICATTSEAKWASGGEDTILGRLSKIVDMSKIQLSYPLNKDFKFNSKLMAGMRVDVVTLDTKRLGSVTRKKVEYSPNWRGGLSQGLPIIVMSEDVSNKKNKYILDRFHPQGFIMIQLNAAAIDNGPVTAADVWQETRIDEVLPRFFNGTRAEEMQIAKQRIADLHNYILASAGIQWYEDIEVADDFKSNDTEEEEEADEEQTEEAKLSAAARRKLSGNTVVHALRNNRFGNDKKFEWAKTELVIGSIDTWTNEEVFWSNQNTDSLLHTAAIMLREEEDWKDLEFSGLDTFNDNLPVRLIKVAQENTKYYRDFKHITKFFKQIKGKTITMANALIRWNTARLLSQRIGELQFLNGYGEINQARRDVYVKLTGYIMNYWRPFNVDTKVLGADETTTGQLISHLDKVGQFQLFVQENPTDTESIAQLAKEFFNPEKGVEITDGKAIDSEIYALYVELLDWAQPVRVLMNMVKPLVDNSTMDFDQQDEIKHYFQYRNCIL